MRTSFSVQNLSTVFQLSTEQLVLEPVPGQEPLRDRAKIQNKQAVLESVGLQR